MINVHVTISHHQTTVELEQQLMYVVKASLSRKRKLDSIVRVS
jgi:hypothetical protein